MLLEIVETNDSHEIKAFDLISYFNKHYINTFLALALIATIMYMSAIKAKICERKCLMFDRWLGSVLMLKNPSFVSPQS